MTETLSTTEGAVKVYEIGYILLSSIPAEKVEDTAAALKDVLSKKGAEIISEEIPELRELAYTMVKKIGTLNQRFDQGYFGWIKFELSAKEIEEVKKSFEMHPDMLRMLLITTVKENTYLGQKAAVVASLTDVPANETLPIPGIEDKTIPASIEDMDKSIDEMVKEA